jgi:uncharacterized membrane protein YgdD (TMEM256/DUF423 family)
MAVPGPNITGAGGTAKGYQQITLSGAATGLTVPALSTVAYVQVDTAPVRWRDDGTAPTSTIGMQIPIGGTVTFSGDMSVVKFIAASGTPVLNVSYY